MKRGFWVVIVIVLALALVIAGVLFWRSSQPPIPKNIKQQTNFLLYYPSPQSAKIDKATIKYDTSNKLVSFVANQEAGAKFVFSMQASPVEFSEVPESYNKYIERLSMTTSFDSTQGKVDITNPEGQTGQTAVMNSKGTLLFVTANKQLSEDEWHSLFNTLRTIQ